MILFIQTFRFAAEPFFFAQEHSRNSKKTYADVMKYFNQGKMQWWGWKDTSAGEVYSNLELLDETATMPTEDEVNDKYWGGKVEEIDRILVILQKNNSEKA